MKKELERHCANLVATDELYKLILKFTTKKIAFKIQYELKRRALTQLDLAEALGVTPQNISKLLKGEDYKISTLVKIEQALNLNLVDRDIYREKREQYIIIELKPLERNIEANTIQFLKNFHSSSSTILSAEILNQESILEYYNEFEYEV